MEQEVRRNDSREPQICGTTWATDACSRRAGSEQAASARVKGEIIGVRGGSEQAESARVKGENMGVSRCQTGLLRHRSDNVRVIHRTGSITQSQVQHRYIIPLTLYLYTLFNILLYRHDNAHYSRCQTSPKLAFQSSFL